MKKKKKKKKKQKKKQYDINNIETDSIDNYTVNFYSNDHREASAIDNDEQINFEFYN